MTNRVWVKLHFSFEGTLIVSHPMANRWWVIFSFSRESHHALHNYQQDVSDIALFLLPSRLISKPMTNRMWVTFLFSLLTGNIIVSYPMTNRGWVTPDLFSCKVVSLCLIPWSTECQWHFIFDDATVLSCFISWPTDCEWQCILSLPGSFIMYDPHHTYAMTNRLWGVFLHSSLISSQSTSAESQWHPSCLYRTMFMISFLCGTESEWDCIWFLIR